MQIPVRNQEIWCQTSKTSGKMKKTDAKMYILLSFYLTTKE